MGTSERETGVSCGEGALSRQARSLWAKSDGGEGDLWLPLYVHLSDAARTMGRLWDEWVPRSVQHLFARHCGGDAALARCSLVFLAGTHDIGKATPVFQAKPCGRGWNGEPLSLAWKPERAGLFLEADLSGERHPTHPVAGQVLLERYLQGDFGWSPAHSDAWGSVVGAHHGNVPGRGRVHDAFNATRKMGATSDAAGRTWQSVQRELLEHARNLAGLSPDGLARLGGCVWDAPTESVACGLVIMADWVASNQDLFPLIPLVPGAGSEGAADPVMDDAALETRALRAWRELGLAPRWEGERPDASDAWFCERFGLPVGAEPRPVQRETMAAASQIEKPSLMVIEAPMGEGKTEAALAAAEILASHFGCGGTVVALPTMATTDAMFGRVHAWLERVVSHGETSVYLAHGKAQLNEEYQGLVRASRLRGALSPMGIDATAGAWRDERVAVSDWMCGRKKGMLASFVVCTVDQVLMGALDMRHLSLRQLALAGKVVIVDECHAYDSYMQQYLARVLEWLGAWGCPVILLSATLPVSVRDILTTAYQRGRRASSRRPAAVSGGLLADLPRPSRSRGARTGAAEGALRVEPVDESYPLITVATEDALRRVDCVPSARGTQVDLVLAPDDEATLVSRLEEELREGGVAGVICDTVMRAQAAYRALRERFGEGEVALTHARYMDVDRMGNEARLRALLGPRATRANGRRPERLVVVGTQVLEQSLDIDFDLLVTDLAPIDLLVQRLGRVHRHARGEDEKDRPPRLRRARCLVRGLLGMGERGPEFACGLARVYDEASLMEALAVSGLRYDGATALISLPGDIARLVRTAYGPSSADSLPAGWRDAYAAACEGRSAVHRDQETRASTFLLPSVGDLARDGKTLTGLFDCAVEDGSDARLNEDAGQRAVRDTQETVEVLLVRRCGDEVRLLPWVGDEERGIERGQVVPTAFEPDSSLAMVVAQCAVRLPRSLCRPQQLDALIDELERGCGRWVAAWQEAPTLAGRLALALEETDGEPGAFEADVLGVTVRYTREEGLSTVRRL